MVVPVDTVCRGLGVPYPQSLVHPVAGGRLQCHSLWRHGDVQDRHLFKIPNTLFGIDHFQIIIKLGVAVTGVVSTIVERAVDGNQAARVQMFADPHEKNTARPART